MTSPSSSSTANQEPAEPPLRSVSPDQLATLAPILSLLVLVVVFGLLAQDFFTLGTLNLIFKQGAVLAIVATGLTFVLLCAEIDLSVGMVALLSACICGVLWEQPFAAGPGGRGQAELSDVVVTIVVPVLVALTIGWLSGWLTVSSGLPSFIITLATMNIANGLSRFLTLSQNKKVPQFLSGLGNAPLFRIGGLELPQSALLAAFVMLMAHLVLQHSRFGRYVYMTGGNRQAARLAGVQTDRIVIACLAISGLAAALGGLVNAGRLGSVSLDQNADLLLNAVACVVLGGTSLFGGEGGIGRTLIGVTTFTVLTVGLNAINVQKLIRDSWLSEGIKNSLLDMQWVKSFDLLRPFLLGVALLLALVIQARLARRRTD